MHCFSTLAYFLNCHAITFCHLLCLTKVESDFAFCFCIRCLVYLGLTQDHGSETLVIALPFKKRFHFRFLDVNIYVWGKDYCFYKSHQAFKSKIPYFYVVGRLKSQWYRLSINTELYTTRKWDQSNAEQASTGIYLSWAKVHLKIICLQNVHRW